MESWLSFISVIASFVTLIGFVTVFIKLGREKGETVASMKEMKERIIRSEGKIDDLESELTKTKIKNAEGIASISSDLSWIKNSLLDIKSELSKRSKEE